MHWPMVQESSHVSRPGRRRLVRVFGGSWLTVSPNFSVRSRTDRGSIPAVRARQTLPTRAHSQATRIVRATRIRTNSGIVPATPEKSAASSTCVRGRRCDANTPRMRGTPFAHAPGMTSTLARLAPVPMSRCRPRRLDASTFSYLHHDANVRGSHLGGVSRTNS